MKKSYISGFIAVAIITVSIYYSFYSLIPHKISGPDTSIEKFSTSRALEHIKFISKEHHFVGSPYHKIVRGYIVGELQKLGLKTEIQSQFSVNEKWGGATMNHNILARIKGTGSGKAMMLLSHYDSAPFASKGASDDAIGIACILEGIRAFLTNGTLPVNDIIVLISDGEEIGLNGAKAFVEHHPWVKDVGIVINFEARGSGGPSFTLMETNSGNEMMVKAMSEASVPFPVANSFLYSVYKMLPNDTDLTMFREISDIEGFNFAFIDDFYDYHCSTDNFENIDINTVEHQGSYLMSMLGHFQDADLSKLKSTVDYIYFNFPVLNIIFYPFSWALPLFLIVLTIFVIAVIYGIRKKKILGKNILRAFFTVTFSLIAGLVISIYGWKMISYFHPEYSDILHGFPYNGHDYIAGFSFLISGLSTWITYRYFNNIAVLELIVPIFSIWLILTGAFTFMLTGASFFIIPLYFLVLIFILELFVRISIFNKLILYSLLSIPGLIVLSPFIDMFPVGLKMKAMPVSAILVILIIGSLMPVIRYLSEQKILYYLLFALALIFLIKAEMYPGFNADQPKPNSLNYVYYTDENKAAWETFNLVTDPWLQNIMGKNIQQGSLQNNNLKSKFNDQVTFHSDAPLLNIPQPWIHYIEDTIINNTRVIEFEVEPRRNVCYLELMTAKDIQFRSFEVNGNKFKNTDFTKGKNSILSYFITEKGERPKFKFSVQKTVNPELILYEASYDLIGHPQLNVPDRPAENIAMPFVLNDLIIIVKKLNW